MSSNGSLGNEFAAGAIRGMGQAAGNAWWMSRWVWLIVIIIILYWFHSNPPAWLMREMTQDSVGYSAFVGKWYGKKGRWIEWSKDAKKFTRKTGSDAADVANIEEPRIYDLAGSPKIRFDAEIRDGVLSHVFAAASDKYVTVTIDNGRPTTYWRDRRKARRESMSGGVVDDEGGESGSP